MATKYKTVVTTAGVTKFAAALTPGGKKVNITAMAVGDGGGTLPEPDAGQTKLINEVWRQTLNKISQDNKHKNYVVAELVIPPETGGFWLREMGLYDDTGTLVAVGNMAESYKPKLEEGSGRAQTLRMVIMLSDVASVELAIDSSVVMASQDYVDEKLAEHEKSRRHPDATLTEKGFTQLSNSTDSTSETLAATPKAVKAANDNANGRVPASRKVNGRELSGDISVTSQDIFNGQAVAIGDAVDLNTLLTPGLYFQDATAYAQTGKNYPVAIAGSLEIYKGAGIRQIYRAYNRSRCYIRAYYNGAWTAWEMQYDTGNKPAATDVDAVSASSGGTFMKEVYFNEGLMVRGNTGIYSGTDAAGFTSDNMLLKSWYGIGFYCSLNDSGSDVGVTGYINTRIGQLEMKGQIIPGNYANFDDRFYTKTLVTSTFYTKVLANATFVTGVRLGTQVKSGAIAKNIALGSGCVITGLNTTGDFDLNGGDDFIYYRPIQYLIGGSYYTAASA